jgi:hypothetical protein
MTTRVWRAAAIGLGLGLLPPAAPASLQPLDLERVVNQTIVGDQWGSRLVPAPGGALAVWNGPYQAPFSVASGDATYVRWLGSDGTPSGPEHVLPFPPALPGTRAGARALAVAPDRTVLHVWSESRSLGLGRYDVRLVGQLFDADLRPKTAPSTLLGMPRLRSAARELAIAALPAGGYVVVFHGGGPETYPAGLMALRLDDSLAPREPAAQLAGADGVSSSPALAALDDGGYAVAWQAGDQPSEVWQRTFSVTGVPRGPARPVSHQPAWLRYGPRLAATGRGFAVLAWERGVHTGEHARLIATRFGADGEPLAEPFAVTAPGVAIEGVGSEWTGTDLVGDAAGGLVAAWSEDADFYFEKAVRVRAWSAGGTALGETTLTEHAAAYRGLALARLGPGRYAAVWDSGLSAICDPPLGGCPVDGLDGNGESVSLRGFRAAAPRLELAAGHFRVELTTASGLAAHGFPLTADSGVLWLFSADNLEALVKIIDGRSLNGHFWVFAAPLSDLAFTLRVADAVTGAVREYRNPRGHMRGVADTRAFAAGGSTPEPPAVEPRIRSATLPLLGGRFSVRTEWRVTGLGAGNGWAMPLGDASGAFWFFGPDNPEVIVKALDGRGVNGHYWIFLGGLSGVDHTITVRDEVTGAERLYEHPAGISDSFADTAAFADP